VLALLYGVGRFGLDFLRARDLPYVDARYLGLTPAQYACIALVLFGLWRLTNRPVGVVRDSPGRHTNVTKGQ
jgi:phosphatidylglycerol:prolipoprotein diacylglycerol transferase